MKRDISVMIKPASSRCNMNCRYCFYADTASHRAVADCGIMPENVMNAVIDRVLSFSGGGNVSFSFQGGEPTLASLDYFERFVDYVKASNTSKSRISYALQTNGTLLDDRFCEFLHDNGFLVGVSLDGDEITHNLNRVFKNGEGSFDKTMHGIELLEKHGAEFNLLSVVTKDTVRRIENIYDFFAKSGYKYLQFITCLEPADAESLTTEYVVNNDEWYELNKKLFDLYVSDKRVSIRFLDNIMMMLNGQTPELCGMSGVCNGQLIIESNGDCFPCDFYCDDSHKMGNILLDTPEAMASCEQMKSFVLSSYDIEDSCRKCEVYMLCRGGCRRERYRGRSIYCKARKKFFTYVADFIEKNQ